MIDLEMAGISIEERVEQGLGGRRRLKDVILHPHTNIILRLSLTFYYLKDNHYIQYKCTQRQNDITQTTTDSSYVDVVAAIFTKATRLV